MDATVPANDNPFRWTAVIRYRCDAGTNIVTYDFEEMADLDELVEQGPHWDTIIDITVTIARPSESAALTVEEAERL